MPKVRYDVLAWAGIIAYNNWVLALVLNSHATFSGATTSELGASGQPWALFFRGADLLAGVLLLLGMEAIARLGNSSKQQWLLRFAMFVLGASAIFEVFVPLGCSSATSRICAQQEQFNLGGWQYNLHVYESLASYVLIFLLPLTVAWAVRSKPQLRKLFHLSWILMAAMVIWGVETAIRFAHNASSYGYEQRIFLILFTAWFIMVIIAGRKSDNAL